MKLRIFSKDPHPPLRFAWAWLLGFGLLVVLAIPGFRLFKGWRAGVAVRQAESALQTGNLDRAYHEAMRCLQLRPGETSAFRVLAEVTDRRKESGSFGLWMMVVQSPTATDPDRLALAEAALRDNMLTLAGQQIAILLGRPNPTREAYNAAGLLAVRESQPSMAREWFTRALRIDPDYHRAIVNLARVEVFHPAPGQDMGVGLERLRRIAARDDEWGIESLRIYVEAGRDQPSRLPYNTAVGDRLRTHPLCGMQDQCLVADWEMRTHVARREAVVAAMTTSSVKELSLAEKRELAA